jgi:hypothetical protein
VAAAAAGTTAAQLQVPQPDARRQLQGCLHEMGESAMERTRRNEALNATRLINSALTRWRSEYPSWQ